MDEKERVSENLYDDISGEDFNAEWSCYRERVQQLLKQGVIGFGAGILFMLITRLLITGFSGSGKILNSASEVLLLLFVGISCVGFPYGWALIGKIVGGWGISVHIIIAVIVFVYRVAFSFLIGMFAYPIALIYNLIKSMKSKRKIRVAWFIVAALIAISIIASVIVSVVEYKSAGSAGSVGSSETGEFPEETRIVTGADVSSDAALLLSLCQQAMESAQASEMECTNDYGWSITESAQIHGIYFIETTDAVAPYHNILKNLDISNAIVIVTGYFVEESGGIDINQWEYDAWIFPNFRFNNNDVLSYDLNNVYCESVRKDDMDAFMEWFHSEYSGMIMVELDIPQEYLNKNG